MAGRSRAARRRPGGGRPRLPPARHTLAGGGPSSGGDHGQRARHAGPPGRPADGRLDRSATPRSRPCGGRSPARERPGSRPDTGSPGKRAPTGTGSLVVRRHLGELRTLQPSPPVRATCRPGSTWSCWSRLGDPGLTGVVMIYSATKGKLALAGEDPRYYLKRQAAYRGHRGGGDGGPGPLRLPPARADQHHPLRRDRCLALLAVLATLGSGWGPSGGSPSGPSSSSRPSSPPWC